LGDRAHAEKAVAVRLLADSRFTYLAIETERAGKFAPGGEPSSSFQLSAGLQAIPINGMLYAFERDKGKLRWYNREENQSLLVSGLARLPVLLLAAHQEKMIESRIGHFTEARNELLAINKGNGKLAYLNETNWTSGTIVGVDVDPAGQRVILRRTTGTVEIEAEARR
jgi:hypothetical protein